MHFAILIFIQYLKLLFYLESVRVWYYPMLMDALLKREDLNVIFVDWERGATFPYFQATGDTRLVGMNEIDFFIILKSLT